MYFDLNFAEGHYTPPTYAGMKGCTTPRGGGGSSQSQSARANTTTTSTPRTGQLSSPGGAGVPATPPSSSFNSSTGTSPRCAALGASPCMTPRATPEPARLSRRASRANLNATANGTNSSNISHTARPPLSETTTFTTHPLTGKSKCRVFCKDFDDGMPLWVDIHYATTLMDAVSLLPSEELIKQLFCDLRNRKVAAEHPATMIKANQTTRVAVRKSAVMQPLFPDDIDVRIFTSTQPVAPEVDYDEVVASISVAATQSLGLMRQGRQAAVSSMAGSPSCRRKEVRTWAQHFGARAL